jgi:hypothetical protein
MTMRCFAIVLFLATVFCGPVLAEDFMPPPWRDDPLTVVATWEFTLDFNPDPMTILPDVLVTVGDGIHEFHHDLTHAHANEFVFWQQDPDDPDNGRAATQEDPGEMAFYLANWVDDYLYKHIWVQFHFGGQGVPFVAEVVGPNVMDDTWDQPVQYGQPLGSYEIDPNRRVEYWLLEPNPNREFVYVHIPSFTWLDQIVIDTISTNDVIRTESETWSGVKNLFR